MLFDSQYYMTYNIGCQVCWICYRQKCAAHLRLKGFSLYRKHEFYTFMIEVHNDPPHALCDGAQSLTPDQYDVLAGKVRKVREALQ